MNDVFISYAHEDKEEVYPIIEYFDDQGLNVKHLKIDAWKWTCFMAKSGLQYPILLMD